MTRHNFFTALKRIRRRLGKPVAAGLAVAGLVATATACATIPDRGGVQAGGTAPAIQEPNLDLYAYGPAAGDSPEMIVQGFLQAMVAGQSDNFRVARSFLTSRAAQTWDPSQQILIYSDMSDPQVTPNPVGTDQDTLSFDLSFDLTGYLDANGVYSPAASAASHSEAMTLARGTDKQWRISQPPSGIVMPQTQFNNQYRLVPIYFPDPTQTVAIPDERWFPARTAATSVVRAFLTGPAAYLTDAVQNPVPSGTGLAVDAVTVSDGVAQVNLTAEARSASPKDRSLIAACLTDALMQLPSITSVKFEVESGAFDIPGGQADLIVNPTPPVNVFFVSDGTLKMLNNAQVAASGFPTGSAKDLTTLSVSAKADRAAGLDNRGQIVVLGRGASKPQSYPMTGPAAGGLVAPVFDARGWLWTGAKDNPGQIIAYSPQGESVSLSAPWLRGRTLVGLAPARDGVRVGAVWREPDGAVDVGLSAMVPTPSGSGVGIGAPQSLTSPLILSDLSFTPIAMAWADQSTLVFLGPAGGTTISNLTTVNVGGQVASFNAPAQATGLAAGIGLDGLCVTTQNGDLYMRAEPGWEPVASKASLPAFAQ